MKNIAKYFFLIVVFLFDNIVRKINFRSKNVKEDRSKSICIIKVDGIGDTIIFLKVFGELYNYYYEQGFSIDLVCAKPCKQLYESQWQFRDIYELNIKSLYDYKYRTDTIKELVNNKYDIIINCAYSRTISIDSLISVMNGNKISNKGDCGNSPKTIKYFTDKIYNDLAPESLNISEHNHNVDFLKWIGVPFLEKKEKPKGILLKDKHYFVLFPGASNINKCWEPNKFAKVAEYVQKKTTWEIVICGGKNDSLQANKVIYMLNLKGINVNNKVGKTDIQETCNLVKRSSLVITNDTSGVHFANLYDVPNVCIARGCDIGRFIDARNQVNDLIYTKHRALYHIKKCGEGYKGRCVRRNNTLPCILEITEAEVLQAIDKLLEK